MTTIKERNQLKHSEDIRDKTMTTEGSDESQQDEVYDSELPGDNRLDKKGLVLAVHFCNLLYASSYWINVGIFPYITKSIGVNMVMYGYLQTTFGALQLLGGPVYGRLGDIFGSRAVLVLAHSCAVLSYFLLATATNPSMLFLSRIPSLLMHGVQGAQMVITDLTNHKERAVALGKLGFSYGAGVIIGPFVGGQLSKYFSQKFAVLFAAFLSSFTIVFVVLFIPKSTRKIDKTKKETTPVIFNFKKFNEMLRIPGVGFIYLVKLVAAFPLGIFQSMLAVVVVNVLNFTPAQHGMFMSYIGSLMIIVQGLGVGLVTKNLNERNTLILSMILCAFGYMHWFLRLSAFHLCVLAVPLMFGGALFSLVTNTILTTLVAAEDTGFALGLSFATQAFVRTLSPTIGGILFTHFGHSSFGIVGFTVCSTVALYLFMKENIHTISS